MTSRIRILGLDPSLLACGWGVIETEGTKLRHIAHGVIRPPAKAELAVRLSTLYDAITALVSEHQPDAASVEEAFLKNNPMSAMKLGHARAICLLAPAQVGIPVGEYAARTVKKSVVGTGAADKTQVAHMINVLLPGIGVKAGDAADALAIAICHAHRVNVGNVLQRVAS